MEKEKKIAYQNKDKMSKILTEEFKGKSFEAYGVKLSKIVDSRPTDMAAVEANELRLDRLFKLEDGSYLIVDYESDYSEDKKAKYLSYIARVAKTLYNELKYYPRLRVLILYTADVTRKQTQPFLNMGDFSMHIEEAFLSEIDSEEVWSRVSAKIEHSDRLEDIDIMHMIIYPLTYRERAEKCNAVKRMIKLATGIKDEKLKLFVLKGLWVFCDKVIEKEDANEIRRILMHTKVEQIYEREKQEALEENTKRVTESVTITVTRDVKDTIAKNFLRAGSTPEFVAANTGLPLSEVLEIQKEL